LLRVPANNGIPVSKEIQKVEEGWERKPKCLFQVLWERGFINSVDTTTSLKDYTMKGRKDQYGIIDVQFSLTRLLSTRSLRLKCELTTSPSCENNRDFIILKRELNEAVKEFMKKGLHIMKSWSHINIRLLKEDRCFNILKKAINIMDALFTYWTDVFLPLSWPTQVTNNPILFLSKVYFGTDYIDNIDQILNYFDLPTSEILLSISKILTKNSGDKYNSELIDSMDITFLDNVEENNLIIINETLTAFVEILQATTILLWDTNQRKSG
jgi:hypothetical protein